MLVTVQVVQNPTRALAAVVEVMQAVLAVPAPLWEEGKELQWAAWLPEWFVTSMTRYSIQETTTLPDQWQFESWVATMCAREWKW